MKSPRAQRSEVWRIDAAGVLEKSDLAVHAKGTPALIVSRGLCTYSCARMPKASNANFAIRALILEARQNSPFQNPVYFAKQTGDHLMLWSWSNALVQKAIAESSEAPAFKTIIPEAALCEPAAELQLVELVDGFEAQNWAGGALVGSQWWPEKPSERELLFFLRSQNLSAETPQLLLGKPKFTNARIENIAVSKSLLEQIAAPQVVLAIILCALLPSLYLAGQALRNSELIEVARARSADPQLNTGARTRSSARNLANRISAIEDLGRYVHPFDILGAIEPTFTEYSLRIVSFELKDHILSLEVNASPDLGLEVIVRALNGSNYLDEVSVSAGRASNTLVIRATVKTDQNLDS